MEKVEMKHKVPPKEKIAATAFRLFDVQGVHLTGINQIIDESDVAKKTFYHHYPSKDDLIVDYFVEKDRIWFGRLEKHVNVPGKSPKDRLLGIFDYLEEWFSEADYCGCPFIRALSEFQAENTPKSIRECINHHYAGTQKLVGDLLKGARPKDHEKWLPAFMSLISGSAIVAQANGSGKVAVINKGIAEKLLSQA
jgi:AcrR family transcriptional regulator